MFKLTFVKTIQFTQQTIGLVLAVQANIISEVYTTKTVDTHDIW